MDVRKAKSGYKIDMICHKLLGGTGYVPPYSEWDGRALSAARQVFKRFVIDWREDVVRFRGIKDHWVQTDAPTIPLAVVKAILITHKIFEIDET